MDTASSGVESWICISLASSCKADNEPFAGSWGHTDQCERLLTVDCTHNFGPLLGGGSLDRVSGSWYHQWDLAYKQETQPKPHHILKCLNPVGTEKILQMRRYYIQVSADPIRIAEIVIGYVFLYPQHGETILLKGELRFPVSDASDLDVVLLFQSKIRYRYALGRCVFELVRLLMLVQFVSFEEIDGGFDHCHCFVHGGGESVGKTRGLRFLEKDPRRSRTKVVLERLEGRRGKIYPKLLSGLVVRSTDARRRHDTRAQLNCRQLAR